MKIKFPKDVSCIRILTTMLNGAYEHIDLPIAVKDAAIRARLDRFMVEYRDLRQGKDITYAGPIDRFAYIYKYVASHAGLVARLIDQSNVVGSLFDQDRVAVAAIGGGPGSEILGIYKYLLATRKTPRLRCSLYDKEVGWGDSWFDIDEQLDPEVEISRLFLPLDVTDAAAWAKQERYFTSDLFTFIYFMSEVYKHRPAAEPYFRHLFTSAKTGAVFLFADNSYGGFAEWFDALAAGAGLIVTDAKKEKVKLDPWLEEKTDFGAYYQKFGDPKITADVAWRVAVKR
jgi:SAM-dependent methyltransferase